MSAYPIAPSAEAALTAAASARTEEEAAAYAGGPVFLDVEVLPEGYASIAAAEADFPRLYGDPSLELTWAGGAWRIAVRFWRPAPPAPVARTLAAALRRPLALARTPEEARQALGGPAELVLETLAKRYRTHGRARRAHERAFALGSARIVERDGGFAVAVAFWRPVATAPSAVAPAERHALALRAAAPLSGPRPQHSPFVGLFERLAPENPDIVLAEEGDGRSPGD